MAYSYYVPITVQSSQVTGTLTDYPALISHTFAPWKSAGNGGRVQNTDVVLPADWAVFSDSGLTTALDFELLKWDATTGEVVGYVKVPSIATSTVVYIGYDDAGVTTYQGNITGTWSNGFEAVYHFGTQHLSYNRLADSTGNGNTLSVGSSGLEANGLVYTATELIASLSFYMRHNGAVVTAPPLTISGWVYPDALNSVALQTGIYNSALGYDGFVLVVGSSGDLSFITADAFDFSASATISGMSTGAWQHIAGVTASTTSRYVYLDGVASSQNTTSQSPTAPNSLTVGAASHDSMVDNFFDGFIDEVFIASVARTGAWLEADYNSQGDPTAFWVLGSETPVGGATGPSYYGYVGYYS